MGWKVKEPRRRVGFVSTRFAGSDGVSLETRKWAAILDGLDFECFYFAGESDTPADHTVVVPEAHFLHPRILALTEQIFSSPTRTHETSREVKQLQEHLKPHLEKFVRSAGLTLLVVENALSLPLNIPLGLALVEMIAETGLPTIAHHHDFSWERTRLAIHGAGDYLRAAFPPQLPSLRHVVINSFAARQLALRAGISAVLIPNVMDFDTPPAAPDEVSARFHGALGLTPAQRLLLQPTRVVPRKRIELALELTRRLSDGCVLLVSHASGDEGTAYERHLRGYAELLGARVIFASEILAPERARLPDGRQVFSLADAYQQSELVTYPSTVEGFGNAFIETLYYRRPIVMSSYEIFRTDIKPKGFRVIEFEDFITDETVERARQVLDDPDLAAEMTDHNYELGRRYYSFHTLERRLTTMIQDTLGMETAGWQ